MNPQETALIFIEFQNDFCDPRGKLYGVVEREMKRLNTLEHAKTLLDGARRLGCKIIHCPFSLDKNWVAEHGVTGLLAGLAADDAFVPGSWGHEIIPALAPIEGEIVLEGKRTLSAFSHTNLAELLRFGGIKNVIVCGFLSNVCAQATAWSAYDLGFQTRLIANACASGAEPIQDYVETQIVPMFAGLEGRMTPDEFLASLQ